MAKSIPLQIKAILRKNFTISWRSKELITELILPIIASLFLALRKQLSQLTFFSPMFLAIAINSSARSLLIYLVEEKKGRYKETFKIMGMKQRSYILGSILYGYIKTLGSTGILILTWLLFNLIINEGKFDFITSFTDFQGVCWLYAIASLNFSLMLSSVFSSPKLASEVTTFITVLTTLLTFLLFIDQLKDSTLFYTLLSVFPNSCISFAYISILSGSNFPSEQVNNAYPLKNASIQLAIEAFVYFLLFFYLDQVFPNEYGVSKHPFFFIIDPLKKKRQKKNVRPESLLGNELSLPVENEELNMEDQSSALYHEKWNKNKKPTVIIRDLVKKFGNFTAVDHLSINLYENEVLCLLGHNGAGKTTTISVLTGLLDKTSGRVDMYGLDLANDLDQLREIIGICNQRDVLYDELTVEEHLIFMGTVKGKNDLDQELEMILEKTQLTEERKKITSQLSGGSKRKLSLAMALIGGSQVIFLDEPTSGMDAMSRRVIWEILENIKNDNRTLVLTTHHLDEAEVLADRIAIMASGKLLACGTSQFVKENFGQGYFLEIPKICGEIEIKGAILDPQSSADVLVYQVPFSSKDELKEVFFKLRQKFGENLKVNLKMNSLEDAFVNIGMDEEKFLKRAKQSLGGKGSFINDEPEKKIRVPECLKRPPNYSFTQQFLAIFFRKWYTTIRTFSNYISIIIPFSLICIGTLVVNQISFDFDIKDEKQKELMEKFLKIVLICVFIVLAFCFNSSIFIALPVLERETNLKYALTVMGCRIMPYWIGTFAFDYLLFSMLVVIFIVLTYAIQLTFITENILKIIFLFAVFGLSFITFSYLCGLLLYKKTSSAMKTFPFFNFFIMYCALQSVWGVFALIDQKTSGKLDFLLYLIEAICCVISPFWTYQTGFQNIINLNSNRGSDANTPVQLSDNAYFYGFMLLFQFFLFSGATIYLEFKEYKKDNQVIQIDTKKSVRVDESVMLEEQRCKNDQQNEQIPIKTINLQKQYENGCLAIKDISFQVQRKEILGLLGPNGAGKSTMFSILTSLIYKSNGNVQLQGIEVNRNKPDIFKDVGICPQFDCIWENLTPPEHLYLFGRMKGLSGNELKESVEYFLETMQLTEYLTRKAGRLSGGNKRKLCVSNALIGGPSIQFFDEPSTGVDPIARRFLWKTVKQGVQLRDSAVVITTHTMQEAESLCDRIAIMVNGQFYCIGTPQELREKFGEGFNVLIKGTNYRKQVLEKIQDIFQSASESQEKREGYMCVQVINLFYQIKQIPSNEFKFFLAYDVLERGLKEAGLIEDFSISQTSLEEVFLRFSTVKSDLQ